MAQQARNTLQNPSWLKTHRVSPALAYQWLGLKGDATIPAQMILSQEVFFCQSRINSTQVTLSLLSVLVFLYHSSLITSRGIIYHCHSI